MMSGPLVLVERVEDVHPFVGAARDEVVEQAMYRSEMW